MDIQYQYAYDSNRNVVHIDDVSSDNRGEAFLCVGCGEVLIPRLGSIRRHHFAHKSGVLGEDNPCGETYLHFLAKYLFAKEFKYCVKNKLSFILEIPYTVTCAKPYATRFCHQMKYYEYDLTEDFDDAVIEQFKDDFKPDIVLTEHPLKNADLFLEPENKQELWVEINVTHPCSTQKKMSGNKIVEIQIGDEEDLLLFSQHKLGRSRARLHNFVVEDKREDLCHDWCRTSRMTYQLYHLTDTRFQTKSSARETKPFRLNEFRDEFPTLTTLEEVEQFKQKVFEAGYAILWKKTVNGKTRERLRNKPIQPEKLHQYFEVVTIGEKEQRIRLKKVEQRHEKLMRIRNEDV